MRRLGLALIATAAVATLGGCGKPQTTAPEGGTTTTAAPASPNPPSDSGRKALQAKLPAPYSTADLENGQARFALCASCHTLTAGGPNMTGPNLHGVFGRKAGAVEKFSYSEPLKASGITWDAAEIDKWIADPKAVVPATKMTFPGFKDPKDRADVIAYLMVETGFQP